jgi:hypothetical protein
MYKLAKRYYSSYDSTDYVTKSQLSRLGRAKQTGYLVHWFRDQYEDPANETPYESREGGYIYIHGGPYNAEEEIRDEFEGIVSEEALKAAIDEVQSDGIFDWAPSSNHPDKIAIREEAMSELDDDPKPPAPTLEEIRERLDKGIAPSFGDAYEQGERQKLRDEISQLRELLAGQGAAHGGIGHNRPPEPAEIEGERLDELGDDLVNIEKELTKSAPDLDVIIEKTGRLQRLFDWGAGKFELAADAFAKRLGDAAAVGVVGFVALGGWDNVWQKISSVINVAVGWLDLVTLPF